eukprot:4373259-Pyramimonas_sp.AAC.1
MAPRSSPTTRALCPRHAVKLSSDSPALHPATSAACELSDLGKATMPSPTRSGRPVSGLWYQSVTLPPATLCSPGVRAPPSRVTSYGQEVESKLGKGGWLT